MMNDHDFAVRAAAFKDEFAALAQGTPDVLGFTVRYSVQPGQFREGPSNPYYFTGRRLDFNIGELVLYHCRARRSGELLRDGAQGRVSCWRLC